MAREAPPGAEAAPEPPLEAQAPSIPAGRIRFARVDPHRAALFLAQVLRFDVIAVGGTDEPITIGIQSATADGALRELAGASSLSLEAAGRGFWLGPPESVAGGGRSKLRGGRRLDVSFHRADVAYVVQLLEDVDRISLDGSLTGTVSMSIREAPARELLGSLARLAGREARMRGRTVTLSGAGVLPPTPEGGSEPCRQRAERSVHAVLLPCVPPAALEVCGTAVLADRGLALVRRRGAGPGSGLAAAVRRGDWVGEPEVRVASIDTDGLTLEDGTRLPLGGSAAPACTEATLQAFSPGDGRATREALSPETFGWIDPAATASHAVECLEDETDPDCDSRARRMAVASHLRHRIVSSAIESGDGGVVARLEVDGRVEELAVATLEAVAQRMRELAAQGHQVGLRSAEVRRDPSTRRAVVQLVDESARVVQRRRALVRMLWAPLTDAVGALRGAQEHAARSGLTLREVTPLPGGTVRLVVGCP